jgi:predicted DNA-binding transcriptional regulator AlpA
MMNDDYVTTAWVVDITGLSKAALAQLRYLGTGPRFYKPTPRTVLYRRSEVLAWIESSAQMRTVPVRGR